MKQISYKSIDGDGVHKTPHNYQGTMVPRLSPLEMAWVAVNVKTTLHLEGGKIVEKHRIQNAKTDPALKIVFESFESPL